MQTLTEISNCPSINDRPNRFSCIQSNKNSIHHTSKKLRNYNLKTSDANVNFNFKYITEAELEAVVKRVRRAKQKKRDEEEWQNFLRWRQENIGHESTDESVCEQCTARETDNCKECGLSMPPSGHSEDMPKVEEDEVQENIIGSASLGTGIADISHAYQLGGVLTRRLQDLVATVRRMTSLLLSPGLTSQYEDEDVDRAIKRSVEFDAMFARNHLYEIQRLLKDTKQLASGKSPRAELEIKISAALKSITQALQVYAKHVSKGSRVKYQQVVPIFQSISTIHTLLEQLTGHRLFPFRQELEVSCSYMKQMLLEMSVTETRSVSTVSKPVRVKPTRHKPSADLSMYNRRYRGDWRRKSASLARAKFGPPTGKKHHKKLECTSEKSAVDKNKTEFTGNDSHRHNPNFSTDKSVKESAHTKEVPHRNATRAVPEDNVSTMMEMIPNECQDSRHVENHNSLEKSGRNEIKSSPSNFPDFTLSLKSDSTKTKSPTRSKSGTDNSKPSSARSVRAEPTNVQLVCLKEDETPKPKPCETEVDRIEVMEDNCTVLTIEEQTKAEALEYRSKMMEYQKSNPHYKNGKALGIVDRLATRILTEMVMDFQKEEMNNVIQTLYNLEFQ